MFMCNVNPIVWGILLAKAWLGIRLKLSSYNLFTFNPSYNYFNFLLFSWK